MSPTLSRQSRPLPEVSTDASPNRADRRAGCSPTRARSCARAGVVSPARCCAPTFTIPRSIRSIATCSRIKESSSSRVASAIRSESETWNLAMATRRRHRCTGALRDARGGEKRVSGSLGCALGRYPHHRPMRGAPRVSVKPSPTTFTATKARAVSGASSPARAREETRADRR